jgi:hypothetical protein
VGWQFNHLSKVRLISRMTRPNNQRRRGWSASASRASSAVQHAAVCTLRANHPALDRYVEETPIPPTLFTLQHHRTLPEMSSEPKTYHGSCHCQAVTFSVSLPQGLVDNGTCDCSHCAKRGIIWQFAEPGDFQLEKGEDKLKGYQFGAKSTTHQVS